MPEDPQTTPSERPILAFFDVDNTLMRGTSLFQLGREAWNKKVITMRDIAPFVWHQMRFIRKGENMGHLKTAREKALELSSGKQRSEIIELAEGIWQERIQRRLYPGTVELTQEHISKGHEVWLVSATPWEIGDLIARKLGLTGAIGTRIRHEGGVYTGELDGEVMHHEHKAEAAKELALKAGADLSQSWAYSDSRNDIPLLELVGNPVVVNPDPILAHHAHQNEWPILRFTPKSIREARRRVRREARAVRKEKRRT